MYSFTCDYSEGAHPQIMDALLHANMEQNAGYGLDVHSFAAADLIRKAIKCEEADIHFFSGGTITNLTSIASILRPFEGVIAADTGHVNVHEAGAIEATGHKVLALKTPDGKLTPEIIEPCLIFHADEHMVRPAMVYISDSTEIGTLYTKAELTALSEYCRKKGLYLYVDGARLGSALTSKANDLKIEDFPKLTDMFYIGGTKNGALLGEALVIVNPALKSNFRYMMKNRGAFMAKSYIAGIQFEELFRDNLFYELAEHANVAADRLRDGITALGYPFASVSVTNQLFPVFPDSIVAELQKEFSFLTIEKSDETHTQIRLVTSWATTMEAVEHFLSYLGNLTK